MPIKHSFTSAIADGGDATVVRPSDWNADHVQSYSPGSFTIATETYSIQGRHLKLTGSQRVTIVGTGTLVIS